MKKYFRTTVSLLLLISLTITLISCGAYSGIEGTLDEPIIISSSDVTFAWDAPTTRTDGTPYNDLEGYIIYYGTSSRNYTYSEDLGNATQYTITGLPPGTWYFSTTSYDTSGYESDFSGEISAQLN
jgi:hypothetical protein